MRVHVRMLADLAHVNPTRSLNYYVRGVLLGVMPRNEREGVFSWGSGALTIT